MTGGIQGKEQTVICKEESSLKSLPSPKSSNSMKKNICFVQRGCWRVREREEKGSVGGGGERGRERKGEENKAKGGV